MPSRLRTDEARIARIGNRIAIAAEPATVFDPVTDLCREPEWNPHVLAVTEFTESPRGVGSRYRLRITGTGEMTTEYTRYDRPGGWTAHGTLRRIDVDVEGALYRAGRM